MDEVSVAFDVKWLSTLAAGKEEVAVAMLPPREPTRFTAEPNQVVVLERRKSCAAEPPGCSQQHGSLRFEWRGGLSGYHLRCLSELLAAA